MDMDYIKDLSDEEKQWLSDFNSEYYGNTVNQDWRKNLHMKGHKKAIFDQTNARNRDIYNKRYQMYETGNDNEDYGIMMPDGADIYMNPEDAVIEFIDKEDKITAFVERALSKGTPKEFTKQLTKVVFDIE